MNMKTKELLHIVTFPLTVVGALNWGLVGLLQIDLVARFLGDMTTASRAVYGVIGLAGLVKLITCFKCCPACNK